KSSEIGGYPELEKEYKKFIRNMKNQRSAKEIGIVIEHRREMLKLHNDISNAENCIDNSNLIEELKDIFKTLKEQLETISDIKN
ncbi:20712_t:CDS:2, partial [Gigaspora margarita]